MQAPVTVATDPLGGCRAVKREKYGVILAADGADPGLHVLHVVHPGIGAPHTRGAGAPAPGPTSVWHKKTISNKAIQTIIIIKWQ